MANDKHGKFYFPGTSWETIRKIIRAYYAVSDQDNPTVAYVAKLAGIHRPLVSSSNNFLRDVGIVESDKNRLTGLGKEFATGLDFSNRAMIRRALQGVIQGNSLLSRLVNTVKARGGVSLEELKGELILLTGLRRDDRQLAFIRSLFDMLEDSGLIKISDDSVSYVPTGLETVPEKDRASRDKQPTPEPEKREKTNRLPIPLGMNRLAYLELPEDWDHKDLPKLLKLLELSLGEDDS